MVGYSTQIGSVSSSGASDTNATRCRSYYRQGSHATHYDAHCLAMSSDGKTIRGRRQRLSQSATRYHPTMYGDSTSTMGIDRIVSTSRLDSIIQGGYNNGII